MRISSKEYTSHPEHDRIVEHDCGNPRCYTLLRDVELGVRVSERIDMLEDETDISWWATVAHFSAWFQLVN